MTVSSSFAGDRLRSLLLIVLALVAALGALSSALAHGGLVIGVAAAASPNAPVAIASHASLPLLDIAHGTQDVTLSVRADVAFSVVSPALPAVGLAAVLSAPVAGGVMNSGPLADAETYLGGGLGMSFSPDPSAGGYVFGGGRASVLGGLHAFWEVHVAFASGVVAPSVAVGLAYAFGGSR